MRRELYLLVVFVIGLLTVLFVDYRLNRERTKSLNIKQIQSTLIDKRQTVNGFFTRVQNFNFNNDYTRQELFSSLNDLSNEKGIAYCILQGGAYIYWSDNAIPYDKLDTNLTSGIVNLNNGLYWAVSQKEENKKLFALILIKNKYSYKNQYIKDSFQEDFQIPDHIKVVIDPDKGSKIEDFKGEYLFSLVPSEYKTRKYSVLFIGLSYLALFIILLFLLFFWLSKQSGKKYSWLRLILVAIALLVLRYIMVRWEVPRGLYAMKIFDPSYYASSSFISSLGDLLLFLVSIWFIVFLLTGWYRKNLPMLRMRGFQKYIFLAFIILVNVGWFVYSHYLLHSIIYNSSITLFLYNFFDLSVYSVIGVFAIFLVFVNYFLFLHFLGKWIVNYVSWKNFISFFLLVSLIAGAVIYWTGYTMQPMTILFFLVINIVFSLFLFNYPNVHYTRNVVVLFLSVVFLTYFSEYHSDQKERQKRKILVTNLENERDRIGEYLFQDMSSKLKKDKILEKLMKNHLENEPEIYEYLRNEYFNSYFRKYDFQISVCDQRDELEVDQEEIYHCYSFFEKMVREDGTPLPNSEFYFLDNMNGRISYIGFIRFNEGEGYKEKTLFVSLDSKFTNTHLGYPKLLLDEELTRPGPLDDYSYAKYKSEKLLRSSGTYSYPMELTGLFLTDEEYLFKYKSDYNHLIYNTGNNTTIVISKPNKGFMDYLAQFSYVFAFFYILFIVFVFFFHFPDNVVSFRYNFKNKIKLSMILLLFLSLLAVGTGTVYYTTQQFQKKQKEAISEKLQSILVELKSKLGGEPDLYPEYEPYLTTLLTKFSNVFYIDMHLYGLDGHLLASSRPEVFEKGLLGRKMNSAAFTNLAVKNQPKFIHTEILGNLEYHSAYVPFYNDNGERLAYLNLPYFTRQQALKKEIYTIVMVMVNIYLFLIILGTITAVLVSNNITKPLRLIQQRLRKVGLNQSNEKIDYYSHDEVGELIGEYNRMVEELEENARKLAQTERESAWREMAKQIAHEIKNPLTPMKLQVQYLKRAWEDKVSNFDDRMKQFTESMISQINTLSGIATEFSNFAKMPRAKNEKISIHEQASNIVSLFESNENVTVKLEDHTETRCFVYADQDQISRVLNNLVKNAIQSISRTRKGEVTLGLKRINNRMLISVSDNGMGIPMDIRSKLFAPNFTTKSSGMGMGLAISKKIIEDTGGKIWYETEVDKGTTFYVELPIYEA